MQPTPETITLARKTAAEFLFDLCGIAAVLGYPKELKDGLLRAGDHWLGFLKDKEDVFSRRGPFHPVDPEKVDTLRKREQEESERSETRKDERG